MFRFSVFNPSTKEVREVYDNVETLAIHVDGSRDIAYIGLVTGEYFCVKAKEGEVFSYV